MSIKVLHIINDFNVGGAQSVLLGYLKQLKSDTDIVIRAAVFEKNKNSLFDKAAEENGLNIKYMNFVPSESKIPIVRQIINFVWQVRLINREIKVYQPDVIHTHVTPILAYALLPVVFNRVRNRVHTLHSDPFAIATKSAIFAKLAFKHLGFTPICLNEEHAKKAVIRYGLSKYTIIRNGLEIEKYQIAESKDIIQKELNIPPDAFVVGCVGRLHPVKNHTFLLDVFFEVLKVKPKAILLIVGDGTECDNIIQKAKKIGVLESMIMLGNRSDVERIYRAMDVFVLPSKHESSSIATVEAQLAGVRCVISKGIPSDIIINENVARLSMEETPLEWSKAVCDNSIYEHRYSSKSEFSINSVIEELKKFYLEMCYDK